MTPEQHDPNAPIEQFVVRIETALRADETIAEALEALRCRQVDAKVIYFYVVDAEHRLVGVISTRNLLLSEPNRLVGEVMEREVVSIAASASLQEAVGKFATHRLLALPVVDEGNRLLGSIDVGLYMREIFDAADWHRRSDLFQLLGFSAWPTSVWKGFRQRMPWLLCNIAGGIGCAAIALLFERVLAQIVMLAMFLPLVLSLGESIAMQSVMLCQQCLHGRGVPWQLLWQRAKMEWPTALLLGSATGVIVAAAAMLWGQVPEVGVIALSLLISMMVAATFGTALPALVHALRLDPKVAAGPVVLTLADIATIATYLGLGTLLLL